MFDLIIMGGSAAATAAGIYAARRGLNFKIISKDFGGEVATSGEIGNWPGINSTDGITLAQQFKDHLKFYGVQPQEGVIVEKITKQSDGNFCVAVAQDGLGMASEKMTMPSDSGLSTHEMKCDYRAKAVIIATGVHPRQLNIPGEKEFRNKGVSYCTTCDGPLFKGKTAATIGGGNSALESALMLSDIASQVYVINKNIQFKGDSVLIENLNKKSNVKIIFGALTNKINGDNFVTGLEYADANGQTQTIKTDGIFIHIGQIPNSDIVSSDVAKDKFGQIKVNANCETNVPGLYAAGDVTDVPFKQIVIAAGQGCIAALSVVQYLNRK